MSRSARDTLIIELSPASSERDDLLRAVTAAVEDRYALVGEMEPDGQELLLLGRGTDYGQLVTLSVHRTGSQWELRVAPIRRAPQVGVAPESRSVSLASDREVRTPIRADPPRPEPPRLEPPAYAPTQVESPVDAPIVARAEPPTWTPVRAPVMPPSRREEPREPPAASGVDRELRYEQAEKEHDGDAELESPEEPREPVAAALPAIGPDDDLSDEEWQSEMRSFSGWRSRPGLLVGGALALLAFLAIAAMAITPRGAPVADDEDSLPRAAPAVSPIPAADEAPPDERAPDALLASASVESLAAPAPLARPTPARGRAATASRRSAASPQPDPAGAFLEREETGAIVRLERSAPPAPSFRCSELVGAKQWDAAARACTAEATAGDRAAQRQLALLYRDGRGVPEDDRQAITWLRRAALLGDAEAQSELGRAHDRGRGVRKDPGEAAAWFAKAAAQGHAWSQNRLGWMYANGAGVARDDARAVALFRPAATSGNPEAQFNLGYMHQHGRGVAKSSDEARAWYRRAAAQGNADAVRALRAMGEKS